MTTIDQHTAKVTTLRRNVLKDDRVLLLIGHGLLGLVAAWSVPTVTSAPNDPTTILFVAVIFGQMSLLGMWLGLGTAGRMQRVIGFACGLLYVSFLLGCIVRPRAVAVDRLLVADFCSAIGALALVFGLGTAAILLALRGWKWRVCHGAPAGLPRLQEKVQFTIVHLMLLTVAVAILLAVGRGIRDLPGIAASGHGPVLLVVSFLLCVLPINVAAAWAALTPGHPAAPVASVIVLATLAGLFPPYCFQWSRADYLVIPATLNLQTLLLLASLLIVRRRGFRLLSTRCRCP